MNQSTLLSTIKRGALIYVVVIIFLVLLGLFLSQSFSNTAVENFTVFNNTPASSNFSGDLAPGLAPSKGPEDAKITIVEFSDFGCPFCKQSFPVIRQVLNKYPDDVRLVYRHFPVEELHPGATELAHASMCAQEQGKFWELHDKFFQEQGQFSSDNLVALVRSVGMNSQEFFACQATNRYQEAIIQDLSDGLSLGAKGTPTWFVNGQRVEGSLPFSLWDTLIQDLL